jgi:ABC-2 type transport system permease protein
VGRAEEVAGARERRPVVSAFFRRDAGIEFSYRTPFVADAFAILFGVLEFYFLAKLVPPDEVPGGYFAFSTSGLVLSVLIGAGISGVAGAVRQEQVQGSLEPLLAAGVGTARLALGMAVYPMTSGAVRAFAYAVFAMVIGVGDSIGAWAPAIVALVLAGLSFAAMGIALAGLVFVIRRVGAMGGFLITVMAFAGGVLFPVSLLPGWVRALSVLSPATAALSVTRGALFEGWGWGQALPGLALLFALAIAYVSLSLGCLAAGIAWGRRHGTLADY